MIISKNQYLHGFGIVVIILALVRCVFPSVAGPLHQPVDPLAQPSDSVATDTIHTGDSVASAASSPQGATLVRPQRMASGPSAGKPHPVVGVVSYSKAFPDSNDVQYATARLLGVSSVKDRDEAEERKSELVYMAASPYYHVDPLKNSIPYLVPKAAVLLNDIGRNFFDSLFVKHIPLHQFIVTSVLRSEEDLNNLKKVNHNVSENSCHLYGTTFDIGYNRYKTVEDPDGPHRRLVRDDTLKWVLSEVLRDLREQDRCYVKYEKKQGCFHITVR